MEENYNRVKSLSELS
jgi:hypothetical protein